MRRKTLTLMLILTGCLYVSFSQAWANGTDSDLAYTEVADQLDKAVSLASSEIADSGSCGENLTWELDSNGVLTISGTGEMTNYSSRSALPWYADQDNINVVTIEGGVTSIGEMAFSGCSNIRSITIPGSVTSIGNAAFEVCSSLTSITIPAGVTSINDDTFFECSSLISITMSDSVVSIGQEAFYNCSALTDIILPDSVISIGESAFYGCSSLASITVPYGITSIGKRVFWGCSSLASITIPSSVTSIDYSAFYRCSSLECVTIPGSVTNIGENAFLSCSGLTSVAIPDSVTSIGANAFSNCSSLMSVTISSNVTNIGKNAFNGCSSLTSISVDSDNQTYSSIDGVLFNKKKTTLICYPAGKESIYAVPAGVTSIGDDAFSHCTNLMSIKLPSGVENIGENAFCQCNSLISIALPSSVKSIGNSAFSCCVSLKTITLPEGITSINYATFAECSGLQAITLPEKVKIIGLAAFIDCNNLTKITVPNSVATIEDNAFSHCSSLSDIYYLGSETDWGAIKITSGNTLLTSATIHYAHKHTWDNGTETTAATCSAEGIKTYTCKECGATRTEKIAAIGEHTWNDGEVTKAATCTEIGVKTYKCSICGKTKTEDIPAGHALVKAEAKEPSCTETGNVGYWICSVCGNVFTDSEASTATTIDEQTIPALGHNYELANWLWAESYDSAAAEFTCTRCDSSQKADASIVKTTATASCESDGSLVYAATVSFEDDTYTDTRTVIIPATGHNYELSSWTWTGNDKDGYTAAAAKFICKNDTSHIESAEAEITEAGTAATCTTDGSIIYSASATFDDITYSDTKTNSIPATGHEWGIPVYGWTDDNAIVMASVRCKKDRTHTVTETVETVATTVDPTCTKSGDITYTAKFNNDLFETQVKEVAVEARGHDYEASVREPSCTTDGYTTYTCSRCGKTYTADYAEALGHDYGEWTSMTGSTCTAKGSERRSCSRCGETETREVRASGHTRGEEVKEKVIAATCEKDGSYDLAVYCLVCGEELSRQVVTTEKLGHNYGDWNTVKNASCTEKGEDAHTCSRCGSVETRETEALGHSYGAWTITKVATCIEDGEETRTCGSCGLSETQEIPAVGHNAGIPVKENIVAAACTTNGSYESVTYCTVCKAELSREKNSIKATGHTPADAVKANIVEATCTTDGSYDSVVFCAVCEEEFSRATIKVHQLGHNYTAVVTPATYTSGGYTTYTCSRCGDSYMADQTAALVPPTAEEAQGVTVTTFTGGNSSAGTIYHVVSSENKTAALIDGGKSSGKIRIPATVVNDGVTYKVTEISANAFRNNKKITTLIIDANVIKIGAGAFKGATNLKTVKIGNSVEVIDKEAFSGDRKLSSVTIGNNVTVIGAKAFYNCRALRKVTIPKTVKLIGKSAFQKCSKLKTITFRTTKLTAGKVGSKAFSGTPSNATVRVPKSRFSAYKKWLVKKGISKRAKVKKA